MYKNINPLRTMQLFEILIQGLPFLSKIITWVLMTLYIYISIGVDPLPCAKIRNHDIGPDDIYTL